MNTFRISLLCITGFLAVINTGVSAKTLVVATYNLWNVMFQWDSRKHYIADMVRTKFILVPVLDTSMKYKRVHFLGIVIVICYKFLVDH